MSGSGPLATLLRTCFLMSFQRARQPAPWVTQGDTPKWRGTNPSLVTPANTSDGVLAIPLLVTPQERSHVHDSAGFGSRQAARCGIARQPERVLGPRDGSLARCAPARRRRVDGSRDPRQ